MYKEFYEGFHASLKRNYKVECLKQNLRLKVIRQLIHKDTVFNKKVLIAGCGRGQDTTVAGHRVYAFDLAFSAVNIAKKIPEHIYLITAITERIKR